MKSSVVYIGQFTNNQTDLTDNSLDGQTVIVRIYDMVNLIDDSETTTEYELEMSDTPLRISIVDNNEDKFTTIRSRQAEIGIHTGNGIDIGTFADGADLQWYVVVSILDTSDTEVNIFKGYLVLDELSQDFLPDPNVLTLVATDGLALLQDIPLTDFSGYTPYGKYKIIEYLAWALSKTGLSLNINVVYNIRQEDHDTEHLFDVMYLDALTFEDQIGTRQSCYDVINKILAEEACLFQYNAEWWIVRPDEIMPASYSSSVGYGYNVALFDHEGVFDSFSVALYKKEIGAGERMSWMNDDQMVTPVRSHKHVKLIWDYEYPREIICNIDFDRGEEIISYWHIKQYPPVSMSYFTITIAGVGTTVNFSIINWDDSGVQAGLETLVGVGNVTVTGNLSDGFEIYFNTDYALTVTAVPSGSGIVDLRCVKHYKYSIECWSLKKGTPTTNYDSPVNDAYVIKSFDVFDKEDERYVAITPDGSSIGLGETLFSYLESRPIQVKKDDIINVSAQWRLTSNGSSAARYHIMALVLAGTDGSYWMLGNNDINDDTTFKKWYDTSVFTTNLGAGRIYLDFSELDASQWQTQEIKSAPFPIDGDLYIWLNQTNQTIVSGLDKTIHYSNVIVDYIPFINGTYRRYSGEYEKVTQAVNPEDYKAVRETNVYINQSKNPNFKGSLFKFTGTTNVYSGSADFGSTNTIEISGDVRYLFNVGVRYRNLGSLLNVFDFTVLELSYSIVGNLTTITVDQDTTTEIGAAVTIVEFDFELAENFWNYCQTPSTPATFDTFGKVRIFSVWNQYKYGLRIFEGTVDQFDTGVVTEGLSVYHSELADLLHQYLLTDASDSTNYRVFMMITNEKDHYLNEMSCVFVETFNQYGRNYDDTYEFKYIS